SAAAGLVAGVNAARVAKGQRPLAPPRETAHGALLHYITEADPRDFRPMNVAFGLFPPLPTRIRDKKARYAAYAERGLAALAAWLQEVV
ncbi:MAG TPA: methylenetetrahydrofolate--tRNA-(uracil(54)-C(5))-methyltransferase (FADH(2)-oxidizing) TrmFO, partial [Peptococcaceae bacterium]|nr:methylenetetrahydrofolate--tRNA-(uracil(54)-C(5))-methyltransferase (FADH(2)-oxidizing) TrmFO [Peptococcaceae bacterium]